jgi:hypothetical protein
MSEQANQNNKLIVRRIQDAQKVVGDMGGGQAKSLQELHIQLRQIQKQPRVRTSAEKIEQLQRMHALVTDVMKSGLHGMIDGILQETGDIPAPEKKEEERPAAPPAPEKPAAPTVAPQSPAQSAFAPPKTETPETTTPPPASAPTGTLWERFQSFASWIGTSVMSLWNSWFNKKGTPASTPSVAAASTPAQTPAVTPPATVQAPPGSTPKPPEKKPDVLTNMMDGKAYEFDGHQLQWKGKPLHLFSIDDKKFRVSVAESTLLSGALRSITKNGDGVVITTSLGRLVLNKDQISNVLHQALNAPSKTKWSLTGPYKAIPITIQYTFISGKGASEKSSAQNRLMELIPL